MRFNSKTMIAILCAMPAFASAQADRGDIDRIIEIGKDKNQVMLHLRKLTEIGPRVTGSPTLAKAQQWAMGNFKKWGLKNVHLEQWGDVPVGFERGKRQVGRMVSPTSRDFQFTTMNWMPGTDGLKQGAAVRAPKTMDEFQANRSKYKGAWILMDTQAAIRGVTLTDDDLKRALDGAGILGRIVSAADERVHSHGTWRDKTFENRPKDVIISVRKSDFVAVSEAIDAGKNPKLAFDIEVKWIKGPVPQYNVVADIPGTEKPEEMVIVCGHLDSWNSPGSQGANDNGTGSVTAIEAARILAMSKVKPKRTIRFILWSGEEQGLLGSRAYVEKHKADQDKISAVLNDDGGSNYHGGYQGIASMKEMMEKAFAPTVKAFQNLPMEFSVQPTMPSGGSSDHAPFNWAGVPGFFTLEKGKQDYGFVWHTQNDRYEYAVPEYLIQSSTNHAVVAFNLAQAETLLPRAPKPVARTVDLNGPAVGADHMYESPELHAGKDHDHEDDWVLELRDRFKRQMQFITTVLWAR
jgi:carboxypeptidase Q